GSAKRPGHAGAPEEYIFAATARDGISTTEGIEGITVGPAYEDLRTFCRGVHTIGGEPGIDGCGVPDRAVGEAQLFDAVVSRYEVILHGNLVACTIDTDDEVIAILHQGHVIGDKIGGELDGVHTGVPPVRIINNILTIAAAKALGICVVVVIRGVRVIIELIIAGAALIGVATAATVQSIIAGSAEEGIILGIAV